MAISLWLNLSRHRRQSMYRPSIRRSVSLLILRAIIALLTPASLLICRRLLPFPQYIVITTLSSPLNIHNLCRIRSTLSRISACSFSPTSEMFCFVIFTNNPAYLLSSGIGCISHPFSVLLLSAVHCSDHYKTRHVPETTPLRDLFAISSGLLYASPSM